ncbi:flagellar biosynthetic protein FliR [Cellvibrio zantedeschiae]|uniref:flagellar biosynthetic protein FliR n=1 Tax=Cellvibrio zantedeschiae TaxID=1237077 RepID=UPI001678C82C|nr:flagellar biosynthetic protein FliR [Cellvibrio zantedeschiae]
MISSNIAAATYVFFRLSPIILVAPAFPFAFIPVVVRLVLVIVFSSVIVASLEEQHLKLIPTTLSVSLLVSEIFLGIILSLSLHAANAAVHMMGQLIDIQTGLAVASTFDPASYQPNSPIGTLFSLVLIICFFSLGLDYDLLNSFAELFRVAPPGVSYGLNDNYFHAISEIFILGFVVASPIIITLWLLDIALSFISKSLPQAQIYFVAMPLKIFLSLLLLGITLENSTDTIYALLKNSLSTWINVVRT